MDRSYEELLAEALSLTHPSGRKVRKDKGQRHNYVAVRAKETKPRAARKDKGQIRPDLRGMPQSKCSVYARVKARLYKKDQELIAQGELPLLRGVDENSYYIVIPAAFETRADYHTQEHKGREIKHTLRRVCTQKELDLERHRFNAWQELACLLPDEPSEYIPEIRQMLSTRYGIVGKEADEAIAKRQITNVELFCEFYHISSGDYVEWDYDTWQAMYQYCPCETLDDDFVFSLTLRPGTPEFHPEFAYHANKVLANQEQAKKDEAERRRRQFNEHWRK